MRPLFTIVILMTLFAASEAQAQPNRYTNVSHYRATRVNMTPAGRLPIYRNAVYREARITMPRNVRMPRNFRVSRNPAGWTPR